MSGPVISTDLYRIEHLRLEKGVQDALASPVSRLIESAAGNIGQMLRDAYVSGLRDGFAQGVAAAARPAADDAARGDK